MNPDAPLPRTVESEPETAYAMERLEEIHDVYRDTLKAYVAGCKRAGLTPSKESIALMMEWGGESLADDAAGYVETLQKRGFDFSYTPDNAETLIDRAYQQITGKAAQ
jgi:hypothetical protein